MHNHRLAALFAPMLLAFSLNAAAQAADEWITINKDYSSQRYVDLDQINPSNVRALKEVCEAQLNEPSWYNSGLLMVGRTIYTATLRATYAVDAATCEVRWRNVIKLAGLANISTRGPAYLDGAIFRGTADGRMIALDAKTGAVLWDQQLADPKQNESFVAAPIAWQGKVFMGIAISDLSIRGRLIALDAKTGKELWRFYTVPEKSVGKTAGGGFWTTFSLNTTTGEVLSPSANPAPDYDLNVRPGGSLYSNSVVAVDAATGKLKWYYQELPVDDHDWDLGSTPTLYRTRTGKERIAVAGKDGWVISLDGASKEPVFKTPGTTIQTITLDGRLPETQTLVCPGVGGGSEYNGAAYDPGTGALYTGEVDWCSFFQKPKPKPARSTSASTPAAPQAQSLLNYSYEEAVWADYTTPSKGQITAIDGENGRILWVYHTDAPMMAGLTPTKGGLVFGGDVRGNLYAFDAKSGAVLNHLDVGGALNNGLISYAVDGTQYVAAAVGGVTLLARGVGGALKVKVLGLQGSDTPKTTSFERLQTQQTGPAAAAELYARVCATCHGGDGKGRSFPAIRRMTPLGDPEVLKRYLANVPPPMPVLYPGLLTDDEVTQIAGFLKAKILDPSGTATGLFGAKSGGSLEWKTMYSVMTSPRCMNCHSSAVFPRQTDDRYPHVFAVERGPDDHGVPMKRCDSCHGMRNNPDTGAPGRIDWHQAPLPMSTEASPGVPKSGAQMCADVKDKTKNGNRDLAAVLAFIEYDQFITWAWDPGTRASGQRRTTPPLNTHDDFVQVVKQWIAAGAPCPSS
jgi:alcohol dehydrogenase (cytochrome c)